MEVFKFCKRLDSKRTLPNQANGLSISHRLGWADVLAMVGINLSMYEIS